MKKLAIAAVVAAFATVVHQNINADWVIMRTACSKHCPYFNNLET
ncbi:MAG: hypothetical protein ACI3VN_01785 [Candidatus Onthomonas sp.]